MASFSSNLDLAMQTLIGSGCVLVLGLVIGIVARIVYLSQQKKKARQKVFNAPGWLVALLRTVEAPTWRFSSSGSSSITLAKAVPHPENAQVAYAPVIWFDGNIYIKEFCKNAEGELEPTSSQRFEPTPAQVALYNSCEKRLRDSVERVGEQAFREAMPDAFNLVFSKPTRTSIPRAELNIDRTIEPIKHDDEEA
jgi:hypothetical protein